jgi:iron complex outermembrane receptor protein
MKTRSICRRSGRHLAPSLTVIAIAMAMFSMWGASGALAQTAESNSQAAQAESSQPANLSEVVVTGTHILRNGYEAPTPLTVVGIEAIQSNASTNVADYLNTFPAFAGGTISPAANSNAFSSGSVGINALNLRNLGAQRTLVLLDGQRSVGINTSQLVDINLIPQSLVSRVDIVTGGASAQYGSDAVAGVVNFVLDKTFTGIKGDISGGRTSYGDDPQWKASLTAGTGFDDDRGHFLISVDALEESGIAINNRPWNLTGKAFITNPNYSPTNGQPQQLLEPCCVSTDNQIPGGIIISGPMKGTAFGQGGAPYPYQYGSLTFDPDTYGSPQFAATQFRGTMAGASLEPQQRTENLFTRLSYDVTNKVQVFGQMSVAQNFERNWCCAVQSPFPVTVLSGNPLIPASVQSQMTALGLGSIAVGTENFDLPRTVGLNWRHTYRYVAGANGKFEVGGSDWTWNAYYQKGISYQRNGGTGDTLLANYANAVDVVTGPNGQPICRSTLTSPNNGCAPYNVFGIGVNSAAAINYIDGNGAQVGADQRFTQDVTSASVSGEPFSDWAGPVSVAAGVEHRAEHVSGTNDPNSQQYGWFVGNFQVFTGGYHVTEGYLETVVPVAKDMFLAKDLELNAAVRATDYSTSGYVTTWKTGATWDVIDGLKFRGTLSRDIRAPNLKELFSTGGGGLTGILNPFQGSATNNALQKALGNPNLKPEESNNTAVGVVLQPAFLPGFSTSIDYWNMRIRNAIGNISNQQIVNNCYAGQTAYCDAITFAADKTITFIKNTPFNFVSQNAEGIDFEASYRVPLDRIVSGLNGNLEFRALATDYINLTLNNGALVTQLAGQNSNDAYNGVPKWRYTGSVTYSNDPISLTLAARGLSAGTYLNSNVVCSSGCPASTANNVTVNNNSIPGALYFDTSLTYTIMHKDKSGGDLEAYLNIIFNKDPAIIANGPGGGEDYFNAANATYYDVLGRVFKLGVRFRL